MELGELCCAPRCCQQSRWAAGCVQLEDHGLNLVLRSALEDRITGCWASPAASCPLDGCCSGHFSAPRRLHLASEQRCLLPVEVFPGCELSQPGPVAFLHLPPWILPLGARLQPYPRGCASVQEQTFQQNNPAAPPAAPCGGPHRGGPWMPAPCPGSHHGEVGRAQTPRVPLSEPILICAHFCHLRSGFLPRPCWGFGSAARRGRRSTGTARGCCWGMAMSPPSPAAGSSPRARPQVREEEPPAPCAAQLRPWQVAVAGGAARSGCR